jgi:hypothetical protein
MQKNLLTSFLISLKGELVAIARAVQVVIVSDYWL